MSTPARSPALAEDVLRMVSIWRKGCSHTLELAPGGQVVQHLHPENCRTCTVALIEAINRAATSMQAAPSSSN